MSLISDEQLRAMHDRVVAQASAEHTPAYKYRARTKAQWLARCDQTQDGVAIAEPILSVAANGGFVETRRQYICCKTCGHWRSRHCTKRIPRKPKPGSKLRREKWHITDSGAISRESDKWRGFMDEEGQIEPCKHTPDYVCGNYSCTSTSCAQPLPDGSDFCPCQKFVSPLVRPRAKAATRDCNDKKALEQMELFPSGK